MIINIIFIVLFIVSLGIIILIIFKKLPLIVSIEMNTLTQQQAEIKKNLMQQKFRRDCSLFWCRLIKVMAIWKSNINKLFKKN